MTEFFDDFNRADGSLTAPWTVTPAAQLQIVSNKLRATGTSTVTVLSNSNVLATSDHSISAKIVTLAGSQALIARADSTYQNYYTFRRIGVTSGVSLGKVSGGGSNTSLVTVTQAQNALASVAAGDTMELRVYGTKLEGYVNGIKVIETTDATISSGSYWGYRNTANSQGFEMDDFLAADYVNAGDAEAPGQFTLNVTGVTPTGATLTWGASTDDVGVISYRIYNGSTLVDSVAPSTLSYPLSGLTAATSYTVKINAIDASGKNTDSNSVTFTTSTPVPDTTPPSTPSLTISNITATTATMNWTAATDNQAVAGYRIYRGTTLVTTVTGLSYVMSALTASTAYALSVAAIDTASPINEGTKATVNITTAAAGAGKTYQDDFNRANGAPGAPWTVTPAAQIAIVSNALEVTGTGTSTFLTSSSELDTDNQSITVTPTALAGDWMVVGRANADYTDYYGFRRAGSTAVTLGKVVDGASFASFVTVSVPAVVDQTMELRLVGSTIQGWLNGVKVIEGTDTAITTGRKFGLRLRTASTGQRWDNFLATDYVAPSDTVAPTSPSLTVTAVTESTAQMNWTSATDNVGVVGYRIYRGSTLITTVTGNSYLMTGLTNNTAYALSVAAIDAVPNESSKSTVNITTGATTPVVPGNTLYRHIQDGTTTQINNVNIRSFDGAVEAGFFYGRTLSYWDGTSEKVFTLPDARPGFSRWVGKTYVAYGDSSGVLQSSGGVDYVAADVWPRLVAGGWTGTPDPSPYPNGLNVLSTVANRHANSFTAQDVASRMLIASTTNTWIPGAFKLASIFVGGNDVGALHNSAAGRLGYQHSLSAIAGIIRSASRVLPSSSSETGAWAANGTGTLLYSGNARVSTANGSTTTITFTVPGNGATLMLLSRVDGTGSAFSYRLDGGAAVIGTTKAQSAPGLLSGTHAPVPIHFHGLTPGSTHTVVITHTGLAGDPLVVDSVLPWLAEGSMPFALFVPPGKSTTAGFSGYPSPKPTNTDVEEFRAIFRNALRPFAAYANIGYVLDDMMDIKFPPTTMDLRINDGLHPNKQGHKVIAGVILESLRIYAPTS